MPDLATLLERYPLRKIAYPAVFLLVFIGIIGAFIPAALSLKSELDRIFLTDASGTSFSIDIANYELVAQKLHLPSATPTAPLAPIATSTVATSTPLVALDKKALTIGVYNATTGKGLAATLKSALVADGFIVTQVGNEKPQATSTIRIKESRRGYLSLLAPVLGPSFDLSNPAILAEDSALDCKIFIGGK